MNSEQLPVRWRDWPREARVEYIRYNYTRRELFMEIADHANMEYDREIGDDPRFKKTELAAVMLSITGGRL